MATGDSFTEGLADGPGPDGHYVGWADRVAFALDAEPPGVLYANLAVRGKLLDEVVGAQLVPALALQPDILSFHAGGNDVLRPGTDLRDLARRYELAVRQATAGPHRTLLFTMLERVGPRRRAADALAERIASFNRHVRRVADDHGAVVVDLASAPALQDPRLWDEDRLHLAPEGHARVAAAVLEALDVPTTDPALAADAWRTPLPAAPTPSPSEVAAADARWVVGHLLPWVGRRLRGVSSGDGRNPKRPRLARP